MYLWDQRPSLGESWDAIPEEWRHYRFDAVDILTIGPFLIKQPNYEFSLADGGGAPGKSHLTKRFEWTVARAREMNPEIQIHALQWYTANEDDWDYGMLTDDESIDKYTDSVAALLQEHQQKTLQTDSGKLVYRRIDGYNVDSESSCMTERGPHILSEIRSKVNKVTKDPPFTVCLCPAFKYHLIDPCNPTKYSLAKSLDYGNMQNYDGGRSMSPQDYVRLLPGLDPRKLCSGISSERPKQLNTDGESLDRVLSTYAADVDGVPFAGLWTWRLNSVNSIYQNALQVTVYNKVHSTNLPGTPDLKKVENGWEFSGKAGDHEDDVPVYPWNEWW